MTQDDAQQPEQADPAPVDGAARPRRISRRNLILTSGLVLLAVVMVALNLIHVPYVIMRPGPATNTLGKIGNQEVIEISGAKTYSTSGSLDFTTVEMSGGPAYPVSVLEWLKAKYVDSNVAIYPEDEWFPSGSTKQQVEQESSSQMTSAQQTATAVALRAAGFSVPEQVTIGIIDTSGTFTGEKYFQVDDVLLSVNGTKVTDLDSVHDAMAKVKPGATVTVVLQRKGTTMTLQVPTTAYQGRAVFGIQLNPIYHPTQQVKVNAGDVGGPSAGLMFTLAIYDKLTPNSLTGGKNIAGTGTIDEDGNVGPIGGIRQKMVGARDAGAQFFLAPSGDCNEVVGHIPSGLTVIKVDTFDQARSDLIKIAAGTTSGFAACTG